MAEVYSKSMELFFNKVQNFTHLKATSKNHFGLIFI